MDMFSLRDRLAVVIGGTGGIGGEIAAAYRQAGARVVIAGRRRATLDAAGRSDADGRRTAYALDARQPELLQELAARVRAEHGPVDVLVNCQGTTAIEPALAVNEETYDRVLDTNLKSVFFACTAFAPAMIEAGRGAVVNIASLAAHTGWAQAAAYSASKWGVVGLTRSFAAEWGASGVRVNAIAPGFFPTDLNRERMSPARKEEAVRRCAMGRMGELPELVGAAIFLASDASAFVNGETLRVDGGYLASGI
ncbi:SDR family NAD(P)-dependent oxidoreductase [Salinarimonas sp. NSM]|uniref:SDR family NAD(P)-dependent oxidoreductase n=1 Tax=Salinarimonas sp. NSM TaxID=3458003 RepID=UPI004036D920